MAGAVIVPGVLKVTSAEFGTMPLDTVTVAGLGCTEATVVQVLSV